MINVLTRNRVTRLAIDFSKTLRDWISKIIGASDKGALALKLSMAFLVVGLAMVFY